MSVVGARTAQELCGEPCLELELNADPKKGITVSRSFGKRITEYQELAEALARLRFSRGRKTPKGKTARETHARLHAHQPFREGREEPLLRAKRVVRAAVAYALHARTDPYALWALKEMYRPGYRYMKCGVMLTDLVIEGSETLDLFDRRDTAKQSKLMAAMDHVNQTMGRQTLFYASSGIQQAWRGAAARKSPAYTTDWEGLIQVRAG